MKKAEFIKNLKEIILDEYKGLNEAKKKSKDVAPQEDIELDLGTEEETPANPASNSEWRPAASFPKGTCWRLASALLPLCNSLLRKLG